MNDQLTVVNELNILGQQYIAGYQFTGIEGGFGEGKKAMLVKEIAEIHGQPLKEVNRRINDNRNRFKDGIDIIDFKVGGFKPPSFSELGYSNQSVANSNNIYLLSERGYAKLLKILEDDAAWELYDQFVDGYFNMREQKANATQLSPELQMFNQMFTVLANQEIEQKRLSKEVTETKEKVENISEIVALNTTDWRKDVNRLLNRIAIKQGGYEMYSTIKNESYDMLDQRAGSNLQRRLTNKQKNMALEGVAKSRINKVSKLDVIGEDKKLLEIYLAVVKDMAFKYQVQVS
ncbi:ORF6N domain-containing protein [Bacillus thuringiensis]|uniref:ORF6N domain-containing protein n=1 Tax=Bacillus thuringiensis TaxID=1428 RepID=UPI0026E26F9E|nr:ORF6N domain-containing protein [Bacillus thuringiensis]MDO6630492.1 ORF6N domain-containing protein [Bacillus thuringiensis]MDO6660683.1 ORF6N domain-containing protein [Bacillus thuringiensis]MDO6700614.1 ORF6N domain-containing protein [Bacillus thuringiensis]